MFCSWHDREIVDNSKRTLDPWYQFAVHSVELELVHVFGLFVYRLSPEVKDVDERVAAIVGDLVLKE